jgi:pimeloyl-ACP methyl ester carboxylesterase
MTPAQKIVLKYYRSKLKLLSGISKKRAAKAAFKLFCTPQYRNLKKLPPIFEKAEKIRFTFDKYRIQGYRWNKGAPKKLLIIHGFESSVVNFDRYIKPFIAKDYEVLAFDAPANGRSSGKQINILIYKRFINEIIKRFGPVNTYMAHSLGGLALSLTLEDMKHDAETKVVFVAPATETSTAVQSFYSFLKLDVDVQKEFENYIYSLEGHSFKWYSISRAVKNIKASILWFHDEEDKTTPFADAKPVMEASHPNVQFVVTKGLGHSRIYRENKVNRQIVDFV